MLLSFAYLAFSGRAAVRFEAIEERLDEVEKVNARLEDAALTTARALGEISGHWNAVYEAMRRKDETQLAPER